MGSRPSAAVLLGGAGAALYLWQRPRLIGMSIGIVPVFLITLHNRVFGHVFVLFSANAEHSDVLVMPPSAYAAAAREILSLEGSWRVFWDASFGGSRTG